MTTRSRLRSSVLFSLAAIAMLLLYARIAMPFSLSPGPIALNYVENTPAIATSGMPSRAQFTRIAVEGYGIVVNLAPAGVLGSHDDERELAEGAGLLYFHVPVDFSAPRGADYERFAAILGQAGKQRTLVHCQINMRASSFVFLYRVVELGEDPDRAYADVTRIWTPSLAWARFLRETLQARGKRLPLELEAG